MVPVEIPTLADLGINKAEAGRLRLVAELDEEIDIPVLLLLWRCAPFDYVPSIA